MRRKLLACGLIGGVAGGLGLAGGCAAPVAPSAGSTGSASGPVGADADARDPLLTRWRVLPGGFLASAAPGTGQPLRPGSGLFIKWTAPGPLALRGSELLVADLASARLWRADLSGPSITAIAGAPVGPATALLLGPDLSAWVLDAPARQVLRFARDGRLLQTFRASPGTAPSAIALADGGQSLLLADGALGQWSEQRVAGSIVRAVRPAGGDAALPQVDAVAVGGAGSRELFWLDRSAGIVYRSTRDGRVVQSLGRGELRQPLALAVDRFDRVFVVESDLRSLRLLRSGAPAAVIGAERLGVQQIGGIAIDEDLLAVSDRLLGQVVVHRLAGPA